MGFRQFVIAASAMSLLTCAIVLFALSKDKKLRTSINTRLVFRLLFSDFMICTLYVIYVIIERNAGNGNQPLDDICKFYLAVPIYFFVASWGWTATLALRFRVSPGENNQTKSKEFPIKPIYIWVGAAVLVSPIFIAALVTRNGISELESSATTDRACMFAYKDKAGMWIDLICFQV